MKTLLVGIGAKARQGKTTAALAMQQLHPQRIKLYALADALKEECAAKHGQLLEEFRRVHDREPKPPKEDPVYGWSEILQWYGTDVVRARDPDYWIRKLHERIQQDAPEVAVITDVRFPNEGDFVKLRGGYLVEVLRKNPDGSRYVDPGRDPRHISELAMDDYGRWDFILIAKDGDVERLQQKAIVVLRQILGEL